jgi:septal ring factor EnvC (AmiA/AmiB activator)
MLLKTAGTSRKFPRVEQLSMQYHSIAVDVDRAYLSPWEWRDAMSLDLEQDDSYAQRRMQHVESRYRRAQFILTGAQAQHQMLLNTFGVTAAELIQTQYRVKRAQEQLEDLLSTIEFMEDQHYGATALRRVG